jgi:hypothetical protein
MRRLLTKRLRAVATSVAIVVGVLVPLKALRAYGLLHYLTFVHTPDLLVMLNEYNGVYRQVFADGRPLPKDPNPSWQGYSSAHEQATRS